MSLNDQYILSTDPTFLQRVRSSVIASAVAVSTEGPTALHTQRAMQAANALVSPDAWKVNFANAISTNTTVINQATSNSTITLTAGNVAAQAALVTDANINAAVSATWNSFFSE